MTPRPTLLRLLPLLPEVPPVPLLEALAASLGERLEVPHRIDPPLPLDPGWLTEERSQLSSTRIIDTLTSLYSWEDEVRRGEWVLALTAADLSGGGRDFVFGEAAVGGRWCVVSMARLGAAGTSECATRLFRESLHELGHLAGLPHCDRPQCLMHPARTVADVDLREDAPCAACRAAMVSGNVLDRGFSSR